MPTGETSPAEPWLFSSPDLLTVDDPNNATWELLPLGDVGVQPPDNTTRLLEENHLVMVGSNPDRLLMIGRSETGKLWGVCAPFSKYIIPSIVFIIAVSRSLNENFTITFHKYVN